MASGILQDRVRERLEALGINAFEAARRGDLGRTFVDDLLRGKKTDLVASSLLPLAAALECTAAYLLGESDEPRSSRSSIESAATRALVSLSAAMRAVADALDEVRGVGAIVPDADEVEDHSTHRDPALTEAFKASGGVRRVAEGLGVSHQAVAQWRRTPPTRMLDVERLSGVSRSRLRPDLYPTALDTIHVPACARLDA